MKTMFTKLFFMSVFFSSFALADNIYNDQHQKTKKIPAYIIDLPSSVSDIFIADASSETMFRYSKTRDGIIKKDERYMSIGLEGVGKKFSGDQKTPLGIYFITKKLDTSNLAPKYGIAAYPLDYPNAWDKYNGRTGYGIWIHGVDEKKPNRPPQDTDGCLALSNQELLLLEKNLRPDVTPVIVTRNINWVSEEDIKRLRFDFQKALEMWRISLKEGDLSTYLSFYDKKFQSGDMDFYQWSEYQSKLFENIKYEDIVFENMMMFADPEESDLFLSKFTQTVRTIDGSLKNNKRLYWRLSSNQWHIVSEDST